jgi:hypothetical protein
VSVLELHKMDYLLSGRAEGEGNRDTVRLNPQGPNRLGVNYLVLPVPSRYCDLNIPSLGILGHVLYGGKIYEAM